MVLNFNPVGNNILGFRGQGPPHLISSPRVPLLKETCQSGNEPKAFLFTAGPPTGTANLQCLSELSGHMSVELRCEGFQETAVMLFQTCAFLSSLKIAKVTSAVSCRGSASGPWIIGGCWGMHMRVLGFKKRS